MTNRTRRSLTPHLRQRHGRLWIEVNDPELAGAVLHLARAQQRTPGQALLELLQWAYLRQQASLAGGGPKVNPQKWRQLTRRERQVAGLAAQGLTDREIGRRLFISPETARTHVRHVLQKLKLRSRIELRLALARAGSEP